MTEQDATNAALAAERKAEADEDAARELELGKTEAALAAAKADDAADDAKIAALEAEIVELKKPRPEPTPTPTPEPTPTPSDLPQVTPVNAAVFRRRAGLCEHPNFNTPTKAYKADNAPEIMQRVSDMGFGHIRGNIPSGNAVADVWANECRKHGIKWIATCVGEGDAVTNQTVADTVARVIAIGQRYGDVMAALEGINEPNHNRSGAPVVSNWATITVAHQKAMWETARKTGSGLENTTIIGPALHDIACENSYKQTAPAGGPKHYHQLKTAGIMAYQDMNGQHSYPGGSFPVRGLDARLDTMRSAYGPDYKTWVTEWGYHNALKTSAGHKPVPEDVAGVYTPRGYIQILTAVKGGIDRNVVGLDFYEHLDDFDSDPKDIHENNFGIEGYTGTTETASLNPANFRRKAAATAMEKLLGAMKDPAGTGSYSVKSVGVKVETSATDVQWQVFQNKAQLDAGTATVTVYRDKDVWNRDTLQPISVPAVDVKITDRQGTQTFPVDAKVRLVSLR